MKAMNLMIGISIVGLACLSTVGGCASSSNCVERACATALVAMKETSVLIACGYYDPAPLERPGAPHVECLRWWHGRWEFCSLDGDECKSKGTAIYGFKVERYYTYDDFMAQKDKWGLGQRGNGL